MSGIILDASAPTCVSDQRIRLLQFMAENPIIGCDLGDEAGESVVRKLAKALCLPVNDDALSHKDRGEIREHICALLRLDFKVDGDISTLRISKISTPAQAARRRDRALENFEKRLATLPHSASHPVLAAV